MRAILAANATTAVLGWARDSSPRSHAQPRVALPDRRHGGSRALDQHFTQIPAAALGDPEKRGFPPVVACRGTRPSQAARSRPRAKVRASPTAATSAVAFNAPMPEWLAAGGVLIATGVLGELFVESTDPVHQVPPSDRAYRPPAR